MARASGHGAARRSIQPKRAYRSKSDAYRMFQSMLASGHPPDDWEELLQEAAQATELLQQLTSRLP